MILLLSAKAFSLPEKELGFFYPAAARPLQVFLFVDNKTYLEKPYLEISLPSDRHQNHVVKLSRADDDGPLMVSGMAEMIVPKGPIGLVICGFVSCPKKETELMCADVDIPERVAVDRTHDVTFSTNYACRLSHPLADARKGPRLTQ